MRNLLNALGFVKALAHTKAGKFLKKNGRGLTGMSSVKKLTEAERGEGMKKKRQVLKFKM
jgi:hypothetical protein